MSKGTTIPEVRLNLKSGSKHDARLILAVYRFHGEKLVYTTKHKIKESEWDKKKQFPRISFKFYQEYKRDLNTIAETIVSYYGSLNEQERKELTVKEFRDHLDAKLNRVEDEVVTSLFEFIKSYIERRKVRENSNYRTVQKLTSTYNHLKEFAVKQKRSIDFKDINWTFREQFLNYLYSGDRKHSQNTADKYVQTIMLFMKEAQRDGLHNNEIYKQEGFKVGRTPTKKIALTKAEVNQLKDKDFSDNPRLEKARDLFLLSIFTGLRYSDFVNIKKENLIEYEGFKFLNVFTQKTGEEVYIPYTDDLKELLDKYDNKSPEKISSQRLNEYIKEVCKEAELNTQIIHQYNKAGKNCQETKSQYELITAHTGRRTWATLMYLEGYPIGLLRQVTGHKSDKMFLHYVGAKKKDMALALVKEMKKKREQSEPKIHNLKVV